MPARLLLLLACLGILLTATVIPAAFTADEPNYLASVLGLRSGDWGLEATRGLPASRELLFFEPAPQRRRTFSPPAISSVPPLYAFIALPFSYFGWRGLVALNSLAFLLAAGILFVYVRDHARRPETPWLAVTAFSFSGYLLEYAQGLWPHTLALALSLGGLFAASRARRENRLSLAALSGILVGLAVGVRYQNILYAACVGLGLALWSSRRFRMGCAFLGALALPLLASAWINYQKFGSFDPLTKDQVRYLHLGLVGKMARETAGTLGGAPDSSPVGSIVSELPTLALGVAKMVATAVHVFWARVVDFTTHVPLVIKGNWSMLPSPGSGAFLMVGAVKKAWLQSCPWFVLGLVAMALAWRRRSEKKPVQIELRIFSLLVLAVFALFSFVGFSRTDGICFNQRYFIELIPLAVAAAAWLTEGWLQRRGLLIGLLVGAVLGCVVLSFPRHSLFRQIALMRLPLAMVFLLVVGWALRRRKSGAAILSATLGVALLWSCAVHLGDDLGASRALRRINLARTALLERKLSYPAGLLAWNPTKDAAASLLLEHDLVLLNCWADGGQSARLLSDALLARGRRIYLIFDGFPREVLRQILAGRRIRQISRKPLWLVEISEPLTSSGQAMRRGDKTAPNGGGGELAPKAPSGAAGRGTQPNGTPWNGTKRTKEGVLP